MRAIFHAAVSFILTTLAISQTGAPPHAVPRNEPGTVVRPAFPDRMADRVAEWSAAHGNSWRIVLDASAQRFEMLHGGRAAGPLEPKSDPEWFAQARHFLDETAAMHLATNATMRNDRVQFLPLGQFNTTDKIAVRLTQERNGVPVEGASMNFLFSSKGELLSMQGRVERLDAVRTSPAIDAPAAANQAAAIFRRATGAAASRAFAPELVIKAHAGPGGRRVDLTWRVDLLQENPRLEAASMRYWIDANTGQLIDAVSRIHHIDVEGTLTTLATPGTSPDEATNPPVPTPLPFVQLTANGLSTVTGMNGRFNFTGVDTPLDITVRYAGPLNVVHQHPTSTPTHVETFLQVQPNQANTLLVNAAADPLVTGQANALISSNATRDFVRNTNPTDGTANFLVLSNTSLPGLCNAFFNGVSVNYYPQVYGCRNSAYSTVVGHELGHWLNVRYGTGNGSDGMGEGNADIWAMYVFDDPVVGRGILGPATKFRDGRNTQAYCGDDSPQCYNGTHSNGRPWMGAAWKIRRNLNTTHGDAVGDRIANSLFLGWMNAFDQTQIRSVIEAQWLTLDDDDGNIDNGTPNFADIDSALREQGWPGFDPHFIDFSSVNELPNTTDESGPYTVNAFFTPVFNGPITLAQVSYSVNGGPALTVPMQNLSGSLWRAEIPGQTSPAVVEYQVVAEDGSGGRNTFPARDRLLFRVGRYQVAHQSSFETSDEGWTGGLASDTAIAGTWERGDPVGTVAQPEFDKTQGVGVNCWFTEQGVPGAGFGEADIDSGTTTLLSPSFDMTGMFEPRISYWRWFSNQLGPSSNDDVMVVDVSNNDGLSWTNVETLGPGGLDSAGGWRQHSFKVADFLTPTDAMRVRFIAEDTDANSIVEAALDDFLADDLGPLGCDVGQSYCTSALNSIGRRARIHTSGPASVATNTFGLSISGVPPSTTGIVFYGRTQLSAPLGDGVRCVGQKVFRLPPVSTSPQGSHDESIDLTNPPQAMGQVGAGDVWNFQFWYADPTGPGGTGSNLSDAVEVTFCP